MAIAILLGKALRSSFYPQRQSYRRKDEGASLNRQDELPANHLSKQVASSSQEEVHRLIERRYWRHSIITTYVTIAFAATAVFFSYKAYNEGRRQADAADENNRPWLSIEDRNKAGNLLWDTSGGHLAIEYTITNTGRSPARDVEFGTRIVLPHLPVRGKDSYLDTIKEIISNKEDVYRNDSEVKYREFFFSERQYIRRLNVTIENKIMEFYISHMGLVDPGLVILTCVSYTYPLSPSRRATCISGYLSVEENNGEITGIIKGRNVPSEQLRTEDIFFSYAE